MTFTATKARVSNRGEPPDAFLAELVAWGRGASPAIFALNENDADIYASIRPVLGPWREGTMHRRAVMLEVLRVLGGFESSWNWMEGVDRTNKTSMANITGQETGLWQVSFDSLPFGKDLLSLANIYCGDGFGPREFIDAMKTKHVFAMEYIARLLRHTCRHNGPVKRHEIDKWLNRDAVAEFEMLLA